MKGEKASEVVRGGPSNHSTHHDRQTVKQKGKTFVDLSAELRNRIYKEALRISDKAETCTIGPKDKTGPNGKWCIKDPSGKHPSGLNLLRVSKQVRTEATKVFWAVNHFSARTTPLHTLQGLMTFGLLEGTAIGSITTSMGNGCDMYSEYTCTVYTVYWYGETLFHMDIGGKARWEVALSPELGDWRETMCSCDHDIITPTSAFVKECMKYAQMLALLMDKDVFWVVNRGFGIECD